MDLRETVGQSVPPPGHVAPVEPAPETVRRHAPSAPGALAKASSLPVVLALILGGAFAVWAGLNLLMEDVIVTTPAGYTTTERHYPLTIVAYLLAVGGGTVAVNAGVVLGIVGVVRWGQGGRPTSIPMRSRFAPALAGSVAGVVLGVAGVVAMLADESFCDNSDSMPSHGYVTIGASILLLISALMWVVLALTRKPARRDVLAGLALGAGSLVAAVVPIGILVLAALGCAFGEG